MNIRIHIDRIVLDGLSLRPNSRNQLGDAIKRELERLLTENGLPEAWNAARAVSAARGTDISLPADGSPIQLGARAARSIYGSLGEAPRRSELPQGTPSEVREPAATPEVVKGKGTR